MREETGESWRAILGDCLEILPTLEADSVDAVITDPPYGVNVQYGNVFADTPEDWQRLVPEVVCWALTREIFCLIFGSSPTQTRDLAAFFEPPQRTLIWAPSFSLARSQSHGFFYRWHPIYLWNISSRNKNQTRLDVLRTPCGRHSFWNHPGTKPEALMKMLVNITSENSRILDPFMGSGTTGVACIQTGRQFIGIEIDEGYFDIAVKRLRAASAQLRLPMEER